MKWTDAVLSALWIAFWVYWLVSAFTAKKTVRSKSGNWFVSRLILVVLFSIAFKVPTLKTFFSGRLLSSSEISNVTGVVFCALGLAFAVWARVHLGRNWGLPMTMREEPELVTGGPYRLVRHPIYSGILLAVLGTSMLGTRAWLLVFVFIIAYFIYCAVTEERLMVKQFPEQYPEYKKRSKMIIPYIF
jgi:protein-S-isoprenylcysteine O-methyltransferase Ste14